MTTIHTADDYAVEQVPIELIEPGDVIISTMRGGTPYVWEVDGKRIVDNRASGQPPRVELQAARETDVHDTGLVASTSAGRHPDTPHHPAALNSERPPETDLRPEKSTDLRPEKSMTAAIDPTYQHPKCYANLHRGCSTKISGEHYISHSLIKLHYFNDPKVALKPWTSERDAHRVGAACRGRRASACRGNLTRTWRR